MAKKSIFLTSLFLISIFYFLFSIFHFQLPSPSYAVFSINGYDTGPPPPPPTGDPRPYPNPTSAVSAQNRKCWNAAGVLITDDCVPCGSAVASNCALEGDCGSCGGGPSVCTGGCVKSHQDCSWQTCPEIDCASGICSWNVDHTWCRSWDCTPVCDLWLPAGTCATACTNGQCTDSCGNVLPCGSPPAATMNCPSSPVNVGDTVTFKVNATDADNNLYSAGIYFSPTTSQSWSRLNNDGSLGSDLTPNIGLSGGSRTITATWQPTDSDLAKTFYVALQVW